MDWRTNSSKIQKSIIDYAIPKLTVDEEERATEMLCLHYYSTGNAFRRVEDSYLHDFCKILRPDYTLPTRKNIGGLQLDKAYNKLQRRVNEVISKKSYVSTLLTDGWSNIKGEPIVNYVSATGCSTIFLDFKEEGTEEETI